MYCIFPLLTCAYDRLAIRCAAGSKAEAVHGQDTQQQSGRG